MENNKNIKYITDEDIKDVKIEDFINNSFGKYFKDNGDKKEVENDDKNSVDEFINYSSDETDSENESQQAEEYNKNNEIFNVSQLSNIISNLSKSLFDLKNIDKEQNEDDYYYSNYESVEAYKKTLINHMMPSFIEIQVFNSIKQKYKSEKYQIITSIFNINESDFISKFSISLFNYLKQTNYIIPDWQFKICQTVDFRDQRLLKYSGCLNEELEYFTNFINLIDKDIKSRMFDLKINDSEYNYIIDQIHTIFFKVIYKIVKLDKFYNIGLKTVIL